MADTVVFREKYTARSKCPSILVAVGETATAPVVQVEAQSALRCMVILWSTGSLTPRDSNPRDGMAVAAVQEAACM